MRTGSIDVDDFWQETNLSKNSDDVSVDTMVHKKNIQLKEDELK